MIHVVRQPTYGAGIYCQKLAGTEDIVVPLSDGIIRAFSAIYKCRNLHTHIVFHGYGLAIYLLFFQIVLYRKFTWVYFCHSYEWEIKKGIIKFVHISCLKYMINSCSIVFSMHDKIKNYCKNYCKMENFLTNVDLKLEDEAKFQSVSQHINSERNDSNKLIMLVGRNVALKNFQFVADTFSERSDIVIIHFGDKKPIGKISNIKHFGHVPNNILVAVMELFDCVCVPSLVEAAPTVTLEAIGNGIPVMVSDIEAHSNISERFKFDPNSGQSLISCFKELMQESVVNGSKNFNLVSTNHDKMAERMKTWINHKS